MIDMLPTDPQLMTQGNYALVCKAPVNADASLSLHDYKVIGSLNMNSKAGSTVKLTQEQNHALNRLVIYMRYNCSVDTTTKIDVPPPTLARSTQKPVIAKPTATVVKQPTKTTVKVTPKVTTKVVKVEATQEYDPDKHYRVPTYSEMLYVKQLYKNAANTGDWNFTGENYILTQNVLRFNELNGWALWDSLP